MRVLNYGSINVDHVYRVARITRPGETASARSYQTFAGGKGANQSAALALAGAAVRHAGRVGREGVWVVDKLRGLGVDTRLVEVGEGPTGHAVIQVDDAGQNSIVVYGGANQEQAPGSILAALKAMEAGDILLLQNEINGMTQLLQQGVQQGLRVFLNPAPWTADLGELELSCLDTVLVNQTEAAGLTGHSDPEQQLAAWVRRYPRVTCVLTLGERGVAGRGPGLEFRFPAPSVPVVDTTGAGDTFIGYYVAGLASGLPPAEAARRAVAAAALCVQRPGAMDSIPRCQELDADG